MIWKPREKNRVRSLSYFCTVMPVAFSITSVTSVRFLSCMSPKVTAEVDCGVSFCGSISPVADRIQSVVQEPVPSVVVPAAAVTSIVSSTSIAPPGASCVGAGTEGAAAPGASSSTMS